MRKIIDALKYLLLALCCLVLSGCEETFSLEVGGFSGDRPIFKMEEEVLLTRIYVESRLPEPEDETGLSIRKTSWHISVPRWEDRFIAKGKPIETITYGQLPEGFTEDIAPEKLIPGKYYNARAYSSNRGYGIVVFKIVEDGETFEVVEPYGFRFDIFGASKPKNLIPEDLEKAAESGDADAQYEIGLLYYYGDGVWDDLEEAYEWFLKSAKQGHPKAQYRVGGLCVYHFVGADNQEDFNWFLKSAKQGYPNAQVEIGVHYSLEDNHKEAVKWFLKAAKQGNAWAMRSLAGQYREGKGVPRDDNEAARWNQKASDIFKKAGAGPDYY